MNTRRCVNCEASMPEHMRATATHCCRACLQATYRRRVAAKPPVIVEQPDDDYRETIGFLNELGWAMRRMAAVDQLSRETASGMYEQQEAS